MKVPSAALQGVGTENVSIHLICQIFTPDAVPDVGLPGISLSLQS